MTEPVKGGGTGTLEDSMPPESTGPRAREVTELLTQSRSYFEVEAEHARGGLGVILRARDVRLERTVAIKELAAHGTKRANDRFIREALITARLQHPGIVPVYEAGRWPDGTPYYAMKLVSGRTLRKEIADRPKLEDRLALLPNVVAIAEAVGYAHAEGVIHRDLKPDNVMIGAFGETVVVDWGLAKDRRLADDLALEPSLYAQAHADATVAGTVIGTPMYMAPEQARGADVDERADVWAIGTILYQVLAAEPPYAGSHQVVLERVANEPPTPLSERVAGVPRDLRAIVDKAMAREPAARYANAKVLADDLSRFLTGQLVGAREYGRFAKVAHWLRRHRVPVTVAAILLAVLAATATWSVRRILGERRIAQLRSDELLLTQARSQLERDPTAAFAWLEQYPEDGADWDAALALIADASSREVARHVWQGNPEFVGAWAVSADGRVAATGSRGVCQVWDVASGKRLARVDGEPISTLAIGPDDRTVFIGGMTGGVWAIDVATGQARSLGKSADQIRTLVLVRGGRAVVTSDQSGATTLWSVDGGAPRQLAPGAILASSVVDGESALVAITTGPPSIRRVPLDGAPATILVDQDKLGAMTAWAMAPGGRTAALAVDKRVLRWDAGAAAPVELGTHPATVQAIAVTDSGRIVSGADDGSVISWDAGRSESLVGHTRGIVGVALDPGGTRVATGDTAGDVRLWSPAGGQLLRGHAARIYELGFGPDGTLFTTSFDRSARAWTSRHAAAKSIRVGTGSVFRLVYVSPSTIATTGYDGGVSLVNAATGEVRAVHNHERQTYAMTALAGGGFAAASWDGTVGVYAANGAVVRMLDHGAETNDVAASPDGKRLATTGIDGAVTLWDLATGQPRVLERRGDALDLAFSPDGRMLAASASDFEIHVHDLVGGGAPRVLRGHTAEPRSLIYGRDGATLYSAGYDGTVRIWDIASATSRVLTGHQGRVRTIALSPDQRYLASGGEDGLVVVWDLADGDRATTFSGNAAEVRHVEFSPDGSRLATAGWDGTVRLFSIADRRVTVWHADDDKVQRVAFSPDGRYVVSANADGTLRFWSIDDQRLIPRTYDALIAWMHEATSARIVDEPSWLAGQIVATPP